jgi:hypothetical protein
MSVAKFQPLTWAIWRKLFGWSIGIIRVFDSEPTAPDTPYKFFTCAVIWQKVAHIHGLSNSKINTPDLRAMGRALAVNGAELMAWVHNGKHRHLKLSK